MANVERRIAAWTMLPRNRGETTQVTRYEAGQQYAAHDDYFHDEVNVKNGGQRAATVLMYLSDVEEGGETVFPRGTPLGGAAPEKSGVTEGNACERALRGDPNVLAVKPRRGDALLFFNVHLNGEVDERARARRVPGGARDEVDGDSLAARRRARCRELRAHGFADDVVYNTSRKLFS